MLFAFYQMAWVASKFTPFYGTYQQHRFSSKEEIRQKHILLGQCIQILGTWYIYERLNVLENHFVTKPMSAVQFSMSSLSHSPGKWMKVIPPLSNQVLTNLIINYEYI